MSNVVKLMRWQQQDPVSCSDDAMNVIRLEMYKHDLAGLADIIGVTESCLYSIRSGRTIWPRPKTFFGLVNALGLRMYLVKEQ